jgi:Ca2+-binding EF-hand superfamily protein
MLMMRLTLRTLAAGFLGLGLTWSAGIARAADTQKDLPGPIDSLQDLEDTGKMLFKMADENNDGQISQKEALDAGNGLVGGFFFRADTNGDGVLSREELRAARDQMLAQKPFLRVLAQRAQSRGGARGEGRAANTNTGQNAQQGIMSLLDTNNDGQIQASEVRQMVQTSVQSLFAAADTNRDGQLSRTEVNAAIIGAAQAAGRAAFQKADSDGNGELSQAEFDKALVEPMNTVFRVIDANGDGQISQQEFQAAQRIIASQIRALKSASADAPNSPKNLLESGQRPRDVAPVPNVDLNARPAQPPVAPAQPR